MEITVDTNKDSHESIKRAIQLLQGIVGDSALTNSQDVVNQQEQYSPMDIFGSAASLPSDNPTSTQQDGQQTTDESMKAGSAGFENLFGADETQNNNNSASEPPQPVQAQHESKDDEPISDRALFADLFTKEELNKMESDKQDSNDSSEDLNSPESDDEEFSDKPSHKNAIEFY